MARQTIKKQKSKINTKQKLKQKLKESSKSKKKLKEKSKQKLKKKSKSNTDNLPVVINKDEKEVKGVMKKIIQVLDGDNITPKEMDILNSFSQIKAIQFQAEFMLFFKNRISKSLNDSEDAKNTLMQIVLSRAQQMDDAELLTALNIIHTINNSEVESLLKLNNTKNEKSLMNALLMAMAKGNIKSAQTKNTYGDEEDPTKGIRDVDSFFEMIK